ncbi:MAG TPA: VOC family protein [Candidatus Sulfotelmatobacter sp.]|nr:VOC family protein [Candidatus Sulfotelmatobacter sp.]
MRIASLVLTLAVLLSISPWTTSKAQEKDKPMHVKRITPVLFVQDVEPCVKFWVDRFGFEKTAEVPDGDKLAFAMLQKGNVELMYQTFASADKDVGTSISQVVRKGPTFLYVEVDNLDETINAVKGAEVVMPKRKTFYGSTEIGIKDPAGHFVTFAEFAAPTQH